MATIELTADNFEQVIEDNDMVVVDFWADWCGPCKVFAPTFEEASERHSDIVFGKVDTEAQQSLAGAFGIRSIPTLMVFKENVGIFNQAGALPGPVLDDLLNQARDLDMAPVHEEIAASGHSHEEA